MKTIDYSKDLEIDPDALDVEWLDQASRYMRYAEMCSQAEAEARRCEEKVKVERSRLIKRAYQEGEKVLGEGIKATGQVVEAYYRSKKVYQQLKEELIEAQYRADMLKNAVFAFQQRKVALENLVTLHGQKYFAGPLEPRNLTKEAQGRHEKETTRERVKTKMRG